jgi:anti-sigma regulatory factor (Ser/Thr protein kinase)
MVTFSPGPLGNKPVESHELTTPGWQGVLMTRHTEPGPHRDRGAGRDAVLLAQPAAGSRAKNRIEVEFEAGATAAASARNALLALEGRVADNLLNDIRLLVSELVTNSVRHSGIQSHDRVHMDVQVSEDTLRVEVADPGEGFAPQPRDMDRSRPGGWGLYLVDQLSDRWGVARNHLNRVWFEMDHDRERRAEAAA